MRQPQSTTQTALSFALQDNGAPRTPPLVWIVPKGTIAQVQRLVLRSVLLEPTEPKPDSRQSKNVPLLLLVTSLIVWHHWRARQRAAFAKKATSVRLALTHPRTLRVQRARSRTRRDSQRVMRVLLATIALVGRPLLSSARKVTTVHRALIIQ